ncbi:MAG: hemolysin III family protein [Bacteroidales bacterium]|nr:hemolysin III family protein [Bacteroidales bacterium]
MKVIARDYSIKEEFWNVLTHGLGLALSIPALVLLVVFSSIYESAWHIVSFSIYGTTLVILYLASTLFHSSRTKKIRLRLNVFDHASIYFLIAGTYTPFLLITIRGPWGWSLFGVVWGLAIVGAIVKLFFTGRYDKISTAVYILMGWLIIIAIKPLIANLSPEGLFWLSAGGISYSIGAALYLIKKIPYNHAIFHVFVLLGSIFHFISVFFYV